MTSVVFTSGGSVKLMLNAEERQQLMDLGYSEEEAKTEELTFNGVAFSDGKLSVFFRGRWICFFKDLKRENFMKSI